MPDYRIQTAVAGDGQLPRDRVVLTTYFKDNGLTTDPTNLATSVNNVWNVFFNTTVRECLTKVYDLADAQPRAPKAEVIVNEGLSPVSTLPREIALCLSYYSERNTARRRGRLFIPIPFKYSAAAARPTTAVMNALLALGDQLSGIGGADVDWSVYSRTTNALHKVSNVWVDDEWDTQRRRGLRAITRVEDTVSG